MAVDSTTYLIVGLGNPGTQYSLNRHNIGFMALDVIADIQNFPSFKSKFSAQVSEGRLGQHKVILLKPQTYMNLSGRSVAEASKFYKIPLDNIYVFHDDLDLQPGHVKLKLGGGAGGHNGLKSLDQYIGQSYWRIRLGIGHPGFKDAVNGYVLGNFHKDDEDWLTTLLSKIGKTIPDLFVDTQANWLNKIYQ
ncbi:aminoacyl-tRNA hydrolase [Candidatus Odyssella acanthamoebae]|uniref:aminoacyl-tRNA hydrolase n=1 Tax=Candidatus Odyssella acanthamoebae TaxID=91604 RepID=UPI00056FDB9B|nr:aminoacyl-tRNA hydrolase [Candidatus Paracaedibacter acanthamoebae]